MTTLPPLPAPAGYVQPLFVRDPDVRTGYFTAEQMEQYALAAIAAQAPYDQTALELCSACGWKTLIPGDCCLNCERAAQAQPAPAVGQPYASGRWEAIQPPGLFDLIGSVNCLTGSNVWQEDFPIYALIEASARAIRTHAAVQPVQPTPLTDLAIPHLGATGKKRYDVDLDMWVAESCRQDEVNFARAIELAHGIGAPVVPTPTQGAQS